MFQFLTDRIGHRALNLLFAGFPMLLLFAEGRSQSNDPDGSAYAAEIALWKQKRLASLTSEDGWLTLIGLEWLQEGISTCGSGPDNTITLPTDRAPEILGTFMRQGDQVQFVSQPGVDVYIDDSLMSSGILRDDHHELGPTIVRYGSLRFHVIRRADQLGVRIKDSESSMRAGFGGLSYFPLDPKWRVDAVFTRFETPRIMQIPSLTGPAQTFSFPGLLSFSVEGKEMTLLASLEDGADGYLFIMFGDATNGIETYGAGRQLYTPLPDSMNRVTIDFNKAYNWPCVFTEFATCPLPPRENILPVRVEAGEQATDHHGDQ